MTQPNELPPEAQLPPTPEGFIAAVDGTVAAHQGDIQHAEAVRGDTYGRTGGDELLLYPNPKDPRDVIRIAPVGQNADERRFPATQGLHVTYGGRRAAGSGTYRIYGDAVQQWSAHRDIPSALEVSNPDSAKYADLIDAMSRASAERPAGRTTRVLQKLGHIAR